jgi:small conductance mechanosensitive channel
MKIGINRSWTENISSNTNRPVKDQISNRLFVFSRSLLLLILIMLAFNPGFTVPVFAQVNQGASAEEEKVPFPPPKETPSQAPARIDVKPLARDHEIRERLKDILKATEWFTAPEVRVIDGVVFLEGMTETGEFKKWAGDLARNTQDVVAVVNQIELKEPSLWDFQPAYNGLREQWQGILRGSPFILFGLLILAVALGVARLSSRVARISLRRRDINALLQDVIARGVGLGVFLVGLYVVFQVVGLTTVALTVMGGTGLLGIVLGIAFRDITENLLASIFLSLQNPFRNGDLIEIAGITGFVQMLTIRATVLMTPDGNHVQIPNATVYKSNIHNYTSNPNRRGEFTVGIGYDDNIMSAQEMVLKILAEHPVVLKDPEPWVLVDNLGASTVDLKVYFWLDGRQHSLLKVKSSVIRMVKRAFQDAGISMPDEARELIFPNGVPVRIIEPEKLEEGHPGSIQTKVPQAFEESARVSTDAEGGLRSEAGEIQEQARQSRTPEEGQNLLKPSSDNSR